MAEHGGEVVGFVAGFVSQTLKNEAYMHFVGVHPEFRQKGLGRALYERFFEAAKRCGCSLVRCVTSPVNEGSVSFHLGMGLTVESGSKTVEGLPVAENYDGHGGDHVLFCKALGS